LNHRCTTWHYGDSFFSQKLPARIPYWCLCCFFRRGCRNVLFVPRKIPSRPIACFPHISQFIVIHNSPLRRLNLPGPRLSKYSGLRINVQDVAGYRHREMYESHLKYGPVVQLGPEELSFVGLFQLRDSIQWSTHADNRILLR
jgi:hypothetical protein